MTINLQKYNRAQMKTKQLTSRTPNMAANATKRKRSDSEVPKIIPEPVSLDSATATESGVEDHPVPETSSEPASMDFATAAECGVEDRPVPEKINSIKSYGYLKSTPSRRPPNRVVGRCTYEMSKYQRAITQEEQQAVFDILKSFNSHGNFSADTCDSLSIRGILSYILGETELVQGPFEYPEPLQRNASIILNRLDTEIAAEQELEKSEPHEPEARPLKRRRQSQAQKPVSELSRLPIEDSAFKHAMRGILIGGESRRRYRLDKNYHPSPRSHKEFGHNGLKVGDWWPQRICALRDGAHGAIQGGIAGSFLTGAFSIVVSSTSLIQSCPLTGFLNYFPCALC